ncbi:hypothetical protein ACLK12_13670 [Escherichia coli]
MAAAALRQRGFHGTLHLFSDEMRLPYERPPLSKAMLLDENPQLQPVLPANWWQDKQRAAASGSDDSPVGSRLAYSDADGRSNLSLDAAAVCHRRGGTAVTAA